VQDVYLGQIPYMTPKGSFVVNGAERVIVSQLHRPRRVLRPKPPRQRHQALQRPCDPLQGQLDRVRHGHQRVMYAYIDRKKKLPVTTLLRAIGFRERQAILEIFGLADEIKVTKAKT
jgi:DNA-directed RNA polymerase subunit beta